MKPITEPLMAMLAVIASRGMVPDGEIPAAPMAWLQTRGLIEQGMVAPGAGVTALTRWRPTAMGLREVVGWRDVDGLQRAKAGRLILYLIREGRVEWPYPEKRIVLRTETLPWPPAESPEGWTLDWWRSRRVEMFARIESMDAAGKSA